MPKFLSASVVSSSPTHSTVAPTVLEQSTKQKFSKKKQPSTPIASLGSPSPPVPSMDSSNLTSDLDLLNQQLATVMATILPLQSDMEKLKYKLP